MTMIMIESRSRLAQLLVWVGVGLLASCGGGGASLADGGISGSGNSIGAVKGFGSVIVNGREFNTDSATIVVDGIAATQGDLRVGYVVVVDANFDDLRASRVEYRAQIKGPVQTFGVIDTTLGVSTLTVLGQPVATNATTNFSNTSLDATAPDALVIGDLVEVSGVRDANGVLVASFLEEKAALTGFKVIGLVSNVTATRFQVGKLVVDYASTGANPQAGNTVEVKGAATDFDAVANILEASSVEVLSGISLSLKDALEIEGYISSFTSATDFQVNGVRTTTNASTQFEGGSAASLGFNVKVEVDGTANASGVLVADKVEIKSTGSIRIEGDVSGIDAANRRLTALNVTFAVRDETELEDKSAADVDPVAFADIGIGDRIEMRGFLDGNNVIASELEREDSQSDARLRGRVTAKDAAASTVTILGVTVTGNDATQYGGASGQAAFFNAVQVGDFVDADWDVFSSTNVPADELSLEND
jgi:hypothetical protein